MISTEFDGLPLKSSGKPYLQNSTGLIFLRLICPPDQIRERKMVAFENIKATRIFVIDTCTMKTKLTLTVKKSIIETAKRYSKQTGKSISQMFEELFETAEINSIKTEAQRSAGRLLEVLRSAKPVKTLDDKALLKKHVARKYA
jgi:Family of unknown function (DUF6364)